MKAITRGAALLACVVLGASAVACLAACGGEDDTGRPDGDDVGTIEVDPNITATLRLAYKSENVEGDIAQGLADGFKKIFKNVTVTVEGYNGDALQAVTRYNQANDMPDIFMSESFSMLSLSPTKNLLLNFTPYIEAEEKAGTFSRGDYYEAYLRLGQLDFAGVQYMIPRSADRVVCHYNKYLIKQAEAATGKDILSKIHNGWTWEEFYDVCADLKSAKNAKGGAMFWYLLDEQMKWEAVWNPIFQTYGATYVSGEKDCALTDAAAENALKHMKKWVDDGICASPTSGQSADFEHGKGVFYFNSMASSREASTVMDAYEETDHAFTVENVYDFYDVVTFPVDANNPKIGAGAAGYCGYAKSEHPELVWQFMKYLLSKDGQNAIADAGVNYVPVRKDMADFKDSENNHWGKGYEKLNLNAYIYKSGELKEDGAYEEDWTCYTDYFKNIKNGSRFAAPLNTRISAFVTGYAGGKTFEKATSDLVKGWTTELKKR